MKKTFIAGFTMMFAGVLNATLYTYNWNIGVALPDANPVGWSDTRTLSLGTLPPGTTTEIVDVNVHLNISGGYNGDLYGYLVHSSGFAVLLNRSGRTGTDSFGYANTGFNV